MLIDHELTAPKGGGGEISKANFYLLLVLNSMVVFCPINSVESVSGASTELIVGGSIVTEHEQASQKILKKWRPVVALLEQSALPVHEAPTSHRQSLFGSGPVLPTGHEAAAQADEFTDPGCRVVWLTGHAVHWLVPPGAYDPTGHKVQLGEDPVEDVEPGGQGAELGRT